MLLATDRKDRADPMEVTLRKVTSENVRSICELSVKEEQRKYVVSNAIAIAEACFSANSWFRAVYAEETPVGFAVIEFQAATDRHLLWRFMIDANHQASGLGARAIQLLLEHIKTRPNVSEFFTSVVSGDHSPQGFYERLGFKLTGEWENGEAVLRIGL